MGFSRKQLFSVLVMVVAVAEVIFLDTLSTAIGQFRMENELPSFLSPAFSKDELADPKSVRPFAEEQNLDLINDSMASQENAVQGVDYCHHPRNAKALFDSKFVWAEGEYLMYWTKSADLPVLASTGPLGQPGVRALFGGGAVDMDFHSGTRITIGIWDCPCQELGFQGSYFLLGTQSKVFNADNVSNLTLAQPFANAVTGQEDAAFVALPISQNGSIQVRLANQMQMADALARINLSRSQSERVDFLLGYHYAQFDERLNIDGSTTYIDPLGVNRVGTVLASNDLFQGKNYFHGGELGLISKSTTGSLTVELSTRISLGNNSSQVLIDGTTTTSVPSLATQKSVGGLLALPTNINTYTHNSFAFIPQVGVTLTRRLTHNLDCSFGYSFIYWSKIVRPGQQIDRQINPTQIPPGPLVGKAAPQFSFATSDFWAQGLQFGIQYRF